MTDTDVTTDKDDVHASPENACNLGALTKPINVVNRNSVVTGSKCEVQKFADDQEEDSVGADPSTYYNVLYCKRSAKKVISINNLTKY